MGNLKEKRSLLFGLGFLALLAGYLWFAQQAVNRPRVRVVEEMRIVLPPELQVLGAFGDRYLAANIGAFRAQTVGVHELQPETYRVLAKVQLGTALLNPRHEDNYYTAAAILSWNGQLEKSQTILKMASDARKNDYMPAFFRGFNHYYFLKNYAAASEDMLVAASRAEDGNRPALTAMASRWIERGYEPKQALRMVEAISKDSPPKLAAYLNARAVRLKNLIELDEAAQAYQGRFGRQAETVEDLLREGLIKAVPADPMGGQYVLRQGKTEVAKGAK